LIKELVENGADINFKNSEGDTPLLKAVKENFGKACIRSLVECGADVNIADSDGDPPIVYTIKRNQEEIAEILLSSATIDKNLKDKRGRSPIHHVVSPLEYGSYENTSLLEKLAKVFDVNAKDKTGKPPIFYAHFQDSKVMFDTLVKLGATEDKSTAGIQR